MLGFQPKITDIVVFNHAPTANLGMRQSPAIVNGVDGKGNLHLTVFHMGGAKFYGSVQQGDAVGQWSVAPYPVPPLGGYTIGPLTMYGPATLDMSSGSASAQAPAMTSTDSPAVG